MGSADVSSEVGQATGSPIISRRRLLQLSSAVVPGVIGAGLLSRLAPPFTQRVAAAAPGSAAVARSAAVASADADRGTPPLAGSADAGYDPTQHRWAFAADTTKCIGCGACVDACKLENHVSEDVQYNRTWVERHVIADDGREFVDSPDAGIHGFPPASTAPGAAGVTVRQAFFMPRLCMQCENAPCVTVCPVGATYRTPDGVVLVDQDRCIGCGYCVVACPYGARYIVPSGAQTPRGISGVADKCTWCYHRITTGQQPACVEACPVKARVFGDLNDPNSPVSEVLRTERVQVLKADLGTKPQVYYVGLGAEVG